MPLDTPHPSAAMRLPQWTRIDDTVEGEDRIKALGDVHLPRQNYKRRTARTDRIYRDYVRRAVLPDYVGRTVRAMTQLCFHREPTVTVPAAWAHYAKNVDGRGTSISDYARQIVRQMIAPGRVGALVDTGVVGGNPYQTWYRAQNAVKWWMGVNEATGAQELRRIILHEPRVVPDPEDATELIYDSVWRDFELVSGAPPSVLNLVGETVRPEWGESERHVYLVVREWVKPDKKQRASMNLYHSPGLVIGGRGKESQLSQVGSDMVPLRNGAVLDFVPFKIANADSLDEEPGVPIMLGVVDAALALYRNSADLENGRHWSGHSQAFLFGVDTRNKKSGATDESAEADGVEFGNGLVWVSSNAEAKAGSFGVNSAFESLENGIEEKKQLIIEQGGRLVESSPTQQTATHSRMQEKSDTSVLAGVARNAGQLLSQTLAWQIWWSEPSVTLEEVRAQVSVKLNPDQGISVTARDAKAWAEINIINPGAVTDTELFNLFKRMGIYNDEVTFDEHKREVARILAERPAKPLTAIKPARDDQADEDEEAAPHVSRLDEDKGDERRKR